jgi:hypothetical protein
MGPLDTSQVEVEAGMAIREVFMIEAQQVQDRRVEVTHMGPDSQRRLANNGICGLDTPVLQDLGQEE